MISSSKMLKKIIPHRLISALLADPLSLIIVGLIIRFLLAPFILNWDLLTNTRVTAKLFTSSLNDVYADPRAAYPPLTYYFFYFWQKLFPSIFSADFIAWNQLKDLSALFHPLLFRFLFFLKLPLIFAEVMAGYCFSRLFKKEQSNLILFLWVINPIILYLVPGFANFDAWPLLFIILSLTLLKFQKGVLAALALGIATAFKLFPIFIFPFLLVFLRHRLTQFKALLAFLFPVLITQVFALNLPAYQQNILLGSNSRTIFFSSITIGLDRFILLYLFFYTLLLLSFASKSRTFSGYSQFLFYLFIPLFAFSSFHLQWLLWLTPFLIAYQVSQPKSLLGLWFIYLTYFGLVLFSQASLNLGMLAPLDPSLWQLGWPAKKFLQADLGFYLSSLHTVLAATLIFISYHLYQQKINWFSQPPSHHSAIKSNYKFKV